MTSFCDLSKAHADVFSKDFPENWGFELSASSNQHSVILSAKRTDTGVETSVKPKHRINRLGADVTSTLVSTGDLNVEFSFVDKLPKGLKVDIGADFPKQHVGHLGLEYDVDRFNAKAKLDHDFDAKKTTGAVCTLFTRNEWSVGGATHFAVGTGLTSATFGGRYRNDRLIAAATAHHENKKLTTEFGLLYHLNKGDIAGQVNYDVDAKAATIHVGFARQLDDASWKIKVGSDSSAALSYTHNWNKNTKVTSAVSFDVTDPSKAKAGVQVKYSD